MRPEIATLNFVNDTEQIRNPVMDMVKNTILLLVLSVGLNAAPDDIILSQAKNPGPGNIQRNLAPVANAAIGVDANKVPVALNAFTQNSATGAVTIAAQGTNQNVTIQPSGTGNITLGGTTGGVRLPSTNTAGLQLYNTLDQVTNVQRLEALYGSNVAQIGTRTVGTAAGTPLNLFSQTTNGGAFYSRLDLNVAALPYMRGGLFTTATGTTQGSIGVGGTYSNFGLYTPTNTSGTSVIFAITPTYNQASGTASNTDFLINRTETAVGSGTQSLIDAQVGGASRFVVTNSGLTFSSNGISSGTAPTLASRIRIGGALSTAAWGTNGVLVRADSATFTNSSTAGSGTAASAVFSSFAQPTLAATNTNVTTSDAATLYIANSPLAGTNQTITRSWSFWVDDGAVRLDGGLVATPQILVGAGAVNLTTISTHYSSTGGAQSLTLAAGIEGQIKNIIHVDDGGSGVLTATGSVGFSAITFNNAGDSVMLQFTSLGWAIIGINGAVITP